MLDTSVLRDLHHAGVLARVVYLDFELLTTDFIERAKELAALPPMLTKLGLKVKELHGTLVDGIYSLRASYKGKGPSVPDLSALVLAQHLGCPVVSRDGPLREACREEKVAVRGTLWLIQEMVAAGGLSEAEAADALEVINRERLREPNGEWTKQINKWRKSSSS